MEKAIFASILFLGLAVGGVFFYMEYTLAAGAAALHAEAEEELGWNVRRESSPFSQGISVLIARRQLEAAGEEKRRIVQSKQF